jgi:copper chaperone
MKTELIITGMTCQNCVKHVKEAISNLVGVTEVTVDLSTGSAQVTGDVKMADIIEAVAEEGYRARVLE